MNSESGDAGRQPFRDGRDRVARLASSTRLLDAQRRKRRIARAIEVAREHRFRHNREMRPEPAVRRISPRG